MYTYFCKIISITESLFKVATCFHGGEKAKDSTTSAAIIPMHTRSCLEECKAYWVLMTGTTQLFEEPL